MPSTFIVITQRRPVNSGSTNVVVWRDLQERQRREVLGARLLAVYGRIEREGDVVHVLAGRLVDLTPLLGALPTRSRAFP